MTHTNITHNPHSKNKIPQNKSQIKYYDVFFTYIFKVFLGVAAGRGYLESKQEKMNLKHYYLFLFIWLFLQSDLNTQKHWHLAPSSPPTCFWAAGQAHGHGSVARGMTCVMGSGMTIRGLMWCWRWAECEDTVRFTINQHDSVGPERATSLSLTHKTLYNKSDIDKL